MNKGYHLGWYSEAGSAQPSVYTDDLSRKSSGQRGRNAGSHSGSAIACFVALSQSWNFPGFTFLICQMPKSLPTPAFGDQSRQRALLLRCVCVHAHVCSQNKQSLYYMLTIVCRASCCLWCSIKWQGGFCFGFFYFFSSFRIPLWAPSVGRCWAEEQKSLHAGLKMGLEARRIQEVTILVEKQSCLMEGQK